MNWWINNNTNKLECISFTIISVSTALNLDKDQSNAEFDPDVPSQTIQERRGTIPGSDKNEFPLFIKNKNKTKSKLDLWRNKFIHLFDDKLILECWFVHFTTY